MLRALANQDDIPFTQAGYDSWSGPPEDEKAFGSVKADALLGRSDSVGGLNCTLFRK